MLTQADIDYMRRTADEYDALLKRWTAAPAYSQEIANLHATFKARAGDVGRMVENGLFRRVLATLDAGVPASAAGWVEAGLVCQACAGDAPRGKCLNPKCVGGPIVRELVPADAAGVPVDRALHPRRLRDLLGHAVDMEAHGWKDAAETLRALVAAHGVAAVVAFHPCSFCKTPDACGKSGCADAAIGREIAARGVPAWDDKPDGIKPGQDSPVRMDPGTGAWDAPDSVAPTDQRQRFEAWADDQGFPLKRLDTSDGYLDLRTHGAWDAWQAATAGVMGTLKEQPR